MTKNGWIGEIPMKLYQGEMIRGMLTIETPRSDWLPEDETELARNWSKLGSVFLISCVMHRSRGSIQTQASRMGLPRRDLPQGRHRRKWTEEDTQSFWDIADRHTDGFGRVDILTIAEKAERPIDVVAARLTERFGTEDELRTKVVLPHDLYSRVALLRKKQGINPTRPKEGMRDCLRCEKPFHSAGVHNRLCLKCHAAIA